MPRSSNGFLRHPPGADRAATSQCRTVELQRLSAKWPAESPDDYRDNLAGDIAALESALSAGNIDTLAAALQSLAEDLEIKLEHCTLSGGRLGGSVVVRVRTLQGGEERKSWQVFYMPRIFEAAGNATPDLFPQLSSPTEEMLVPGRYVMWVRDPATARSANAPSSRLAKARRSCSWICPYRRRCHDERRRPLCSGATGACGSPLRRLLLAGMAAAVAPLRPPSATARWTSGVCGVGFGRDRGLCDPAVHVVAPCRATGDLGGRGAVALALGSARSSRRLRERACTAQYADKPVVIGAR